MYDPSPSSGVTYIGPRSFAIAFGATCALFVALLLGINIVSSRFADDPAPAIAANPASMPIVAETVASPVQTPAPARITASLSAARVVPHATAPVASHATALATHAGAPSAKEVTLAAQLRPAAPLGSEKPAVSTRGGVSMPLAEASRRRVAASPRVLDEPHARTQANVRVASRKFVVRQRPPARFPLRSRSAYASRTPSSLTAAPTGLLLVPFASGAPAGNAGALQPAPPQRGTLLVVARPAPAPAAATPPAAVTPASVPASSASTPAP